MVRSGTFRPPGPNLTLILKAVEPAPDASRPAYEGVTGKFIDWDNRRIAQKAAELSRIADFLSDYRNQGRTAVVFWVDHTDGRLICNNAWKSWMALYHRELRIASRPTEHTHVIASSFSRVSALRHGIDHTPDPR